MPVVAAPVFLLPDEARSLASALADSGLIGNSLRAERDALEGFMQEPVSVPGSGPGGGVAHEQHKRNYLMLFSAGRFWMITGEVRYAERVKDVLIAYAQVFESLPFAVPNTPNPPGRLFHQILNEHMWLLWASAGYSCVREWLEEADRELVENHLFAPMVEMFTATYRHHFDIIHNHGMWACAAVGIAGIATQRKDWLELGVYGQFGDGRTAGFLAQLKSLFSPAGYYEEGPYYQRFAIQPMLLFAEALERHWPELGIYRFHDGVVRRGFYAALYPSFPDGTLVPLNDAIKSMNIDSLGYVIGASLMFRRYASDAPDARLVCLARRHRRVWPDGAGIALSEAVARAREDIADACLPSVELSCGPAGDAGAVGILRTTGADGKVAMACMDYGSHGLAEHAHFDGLTLSFFVRGHEALRDYGAVRWINVEPKQGGSYLPENLSFAKQTIAHNTITVDEISQHGGVADLAVGSHGKSVQFQGDACDAQMMTGAIRDFTPGIAMQRSVALLRHADFEHPVLVDLFRVLADAPHQYDYALYYKGQVIRMDCPYTPAEHLRAVGEKPGYRHLWRLGSGELPAGQGLVSWLHDESYHSLIFAVDAPCELIMTRIGANDPAFNLRAEPGMILRTRAQDAVYACVVESHGFFEERTETSRRARGRIERVEIVGSTADHSILRLHGSDTQWLVGLAHESAADDMHCVQHDAGMLRWQGAVTLQRVVPGSQV